MRCWRIDLWRNFSRYVDGQLPTRAVRRIENHMLDCARCRARLASIRAGHRFALQMPRPALERDPWERIEAAIDAGESSRPAALIRPRLSALRLTLQSRRVVAAGIVILALLAPAAFILQERISAPDQQRDSTVESHGLDLDEFHAVKISDIALNTEPHVVAEGYVSEVRIDHEDGDLLFKLVEHLQQSEPFIVCEIVRPIRLAAPPVGSRVRVYGVSRYDSKAEHQWHEVHPVLNIEVMPN